MTEPNEMLAIKIEQLERDALEVMKEFGFDKIQAINHVKQRRELGRLADVARHQQIQSALSTLFAN